MFGIVTTAAARSSRFPRVATMALAALLWCAAGLAQVIEQFPIAGGPWSIALGPDGAMWFTQFDSAVGRIDSSGIVTGLPVPRSLGDIALGPASDLWLTSAVGGPSNKTVAAWISRLATSGALTEFPVSDAGSITAGPDGNLWFTESTNSRIGRITPSGTVTEFVLPTASTAVDIIAGPDGNIWFTMPEGSKIGQITRSGTVTEFTVPFGAPYGIAAGPDGNVWFTDRYLPKIGRITPTGEITQFPSSTAAYTIVAGTDGNLWAAGVRTLMRITPSGSIADFSSPTVLENGWLPPNPSAIAAAPDGSIWVSDSVTSQIVRFALPTACMVEASALCLNGRFRVTSSWRTRDGANGQAHGVAVSGDSGYFWFFDPANVEVLVKVLNGCGLNSHYWTFAAGLTDVNVTLTVTDTLTGAIKTYTNSQGTPFQPIQDTSAFSTCP